MKITAYYRPKESHDIFISQVPTPVDPEDPDYIHGDLEKWKLNADTQDNSGRTISFEIYFFAFKNTIVENERYILTQMHIPTVLLEPNIGKEGKYKYAGLFLMKPTPGNTWFDESLFDHGQYGCPIAIEPSGVSKASTETSIPYHIEFSNNYYFPMALSNWQIVFYVTEDPERWNLYYPETKNISIDYPAEYDTTLAIYYTRSISFPWKKDNDSASEHRLELEKESIVGYLADDENFKNKIKRELNIP